jgi:hypothetical protein
VNTDLINVVLEGDAILFINLRSNERRGKKRITVGRLKKCHFVKNIQGKNMFNCVTIGEKH